MSGSPGTGRPGPPSDGNARFAHVYMDESNFRISGGTANKKRLSVHPKAPLDWH
ncbi:hypothetical protein FOYG_09250 [Fusarium oxysporum NRRL 32931]|uniref:Uncharacterized protein n=1 Tax=Fusarium oxysporum NRRL 32931 TaxID=660029 RepID=W9I5T7_FUSOX|nr:hypothetical protein FOYG_09250 [Fusarium oxysporum NRRL 32931]